MVEQTSFSHWRHLYDKGARARTHTERNCLCFCFYITPWTTRAPLLRHHSVITNSKPAFRIQILRCNDDVSINICVASTFPATFNIPEKHWLISSSALWPYCLPQYAIISHFIRVTYRCRLATISSFQPYIFGTSGLIRCSNTALTPPGSLL